GDDHHVLREARRHGERFGERSEEEIPGVERCADDDVAVVELSRDQSPAVPPVEQTVAATFGHTVELGGQAAEIGDLHRAMPACPPCKASGGLLDSVRMPPNTSLVSSDMARISYDEQTAAAYKAVREVPRDGLREWRDAVRRHLRPSPGMTLVDIGAGTGAFSAAFSDWFDIRV